MTLTSRSTLSMRSTIGIVDALMMHGQVRLTIIIVLIKIDPDTKHSCRLKTLAQLKFCITFNSTTPSLPSKGIILPASLMMKYVSVSPVQTPECASVIVD